MVKKLIVITLSIVIAVSAIVLFEVRFKEQNYKNGIETVGTGRSASSQVLAFISTFGWEVNEEPDEVREVVIPAEFDEVYSNYNAIQKKQGYDLLKYAGKRVKRWTYTVLNYPGYEEEEFIKINVLMCDNEIIGGDVCSIRLDGFMHGFSKEQ